MTDPAHPRRTSEDEPTAADTNGIPVLWVRDAEDYRPPAREAWCLACDGSQPTGAAGCLTCRARAA